MANEEGQEEAKSLVRPFNVSREIEEAFAFVRDHEGARRGTLINVDRETVLALVSG